MHRFHGPKFISSLDGLVMELIPEADPDCAGEVCSRQFSGDRSQQWLLQPDSMTGKFALVSLHDGKYLALSSPQMVAAASSPYFWKLEEDDIGRYSLWNPSNDRKLSLPTPQGPCTIAVPMVSNESVTKFIILDNTSENREALRIGAIGPYAYPLASVYYTAGTPRQIIVRNHLDTDLYAAVSGPGNTSQWTIEPGKQAYWNRAADSCIHISTLLTDSGEQRAQVYRGYSGMMLHLQSLDALAAWRGITSVPAERAKYTEDLERPKHIGIKNELDFDIYVPVFSTIKDVGNTRQYCVKPGATDFWTRWVPETVFVGVGSAPGLPQAYVGRPGYVLHINEWQPSGVVKR